MSTVYYFLAKDAKMSEEQKARIREAAKRPFVYDEDCPPLTREELKRMKRRPVDPNKYLTTLVIEQ